jgi:hypothetical protein
VNILLAKRHRCADGFSCYLATGVNTIAVIVNTFPVRPNIWAIIDISYVLLEKAGAFDVSGRK